jgi:APA family basic amino acid/polyamine antiporter
MVKRLFRRKFLHHILEDLDIEQHRLHRSLNAFDLTVLGIGAIGVGIFLTPRGYAGPGVILSFVISGIACAFAGLLCGTRLIHSGAGALQLRLCNHGRTRWIIG